MGIIRIYDLPEIAEGSHSLRTSMALGNRRTSKSLGEDPVLMVWQKLEALNQTSDSIATNICKESCFGKRAHCVTHHRPLCNYTCVMER